METNKNTSKEITVTTALGKITASEYKDPLNPGIGLSFEQPDGYRYQCALLEATEQKEMRLMVWGDETNESYSHAFPFSTAGTPKSDSGKVVKKGDDVFEFRIGIHLDTHSGLPSRFAEYEYIGTVSFVNEAEGIFTVLTEEGGHRGYETEYIGVVESLSKFNLNGFAIGKEATEAALEKARMMLKNDIGGEMVHLRQLHEAMFEMPPIRVTPSKAWVLTDDDCSQWVKYLSAQKYCLIEMRGYSSSQAQAEKDRLYRVCADVVDLSGLLDTNDAAGQRALSHYLTAYGYNDGMTALRQENGEDGANQILAECVFESNMNLESLFVGTEDACRDFIKGFVEHEWRGFCRSFAGPF